LLNNISKILACIWRASSIIKSISDNLSFVTGGFSEQFQQAMTHAAKTIDAAAKDGIKAIIQPGRSMRDTEPSA
jgi:hypothetical protein